MTNAKPKRAVSAARKSTDKRTVGTPLNPKKVDNAANAANYKPPKAVQVVKGKAGRPKKVR